MIKKVVSWNVNGIRAIEKKGFLDILYSQNADIFAIQETKSKPEQLSSEIISPIGYKTYWFSAEKPGYSGLGIFVKDNIKCEIEYGMGIKEFDNEGRTLTLFIEDLIFTNAYFPNSQGLGKRLNYKVDYCNAMIEYLAKYKDKNILLSGDYNIAHTPIDLANPKDNEFSPGYFIEEREWMSKFLSLNYYDTFRMFNSEPNNYTWWSYRTRARERNVGWRIDYHSANEKLKDKVKTSYHNNDILGSDHCPVTIILK